MKKKSVFLPVFAVCLLLSCENPNTKKNEADIREPSVAGSFYPAQPEDLKQMINGFLKEVPEPVPGDPILGLIVPHAGYVYSGKVAAYAYKQVQGKDYRSVIILAGSHRYPLDSPSVYRKGKFKTPLGLAEVDTELADAIMKNFPGMGSGTEAHKEEHSIEVQVPFLQTVLGKDIRIVPVLMGNISADILDRLSTAIHQAIKDKSNILIIASSDLSHYPDDKNAKKADTETIGLISQYKLKTLLEREARVAGSGIDNLVTYQCGLGPVLTLLMVSQKFKEPKADLLEYKNSGDVSWVKERVVGYASMTITTKNYNSNVNSNPENGFSLSREEKEFLLKTARQTIEEYVKNGKIPKIDTASANLKKNAGAFVTLNEGNDLRGCIGYILPVKPLYQTVIENAVNACSKDYRFSPVSGEELKKITIEISVLSPPVPVKSYKEIIIGKHGMILRKGPYQAVFLPQVAPEQGWDLETTLTHLSMKAGLGPDDWKKETEFEVFTAIVFGEKE
ncbi:MAG: AmmeMemoRadiSam system protein B [bacterium]|nr:AmmeMemoRadiSam system protein B [bacterium]